MFGHERPIAYVECDTAMGSEKKISQLYNPVLIMAINYRFITVRSNWASTTWKVKGIEVVFSCELLKYGCC